MEPNDQHRRPIRGASVAAAIAIAIGGFALSGCEEDADEVIELTHRETYDEAEAVSVPEPGEFQDVPPAPQQGIGGATCMRARLCCEELVATMALHSEELSFEPPEGCAEVAPPGAEDPVNACEDSMRQWRNALEVANVEVPPHCQLAG